MDSCTRIYRISDIPSCHLVHHQSLLAMTVCESCKCCGGGQAPPHALSLELAETIASRDHWGIDEIRPMESVMVCAASNPADMGKLRVALPTLTQAHCTTMTAPSVCAAQSHASVRMNLSWTLRAIRATQGSKTTDNRNFQEQRAGCE